MMTQEQQKQCEENLANRINEVMDNDVPMELFLTELRDSLFAYPRKLVREENGKEIRYSHHLDIDHLLGTLIKSLED